MSVGAWQGRVGPEGGLKPVTQHGRSPVKVVVNRNPRELTLKTAQAAALVNSRRMRVGQATGQQAAGRVVPGTYGARKLESSTTLERQEHSFMRREGAHDEEREDVHQQAAHP